MSHYQYSSGQFSSFGSLQFGGTDLELIAWPTGADLNIVVMKSRVEVYRTTLRGAVTMWVQPAPRALIEHQVNLDTYGR